MSQEVTLSLYRLGTLLGEMQARIDVAKGEMARSYQELSEQAAEHLASLTIGQPVREERDQFFLGFGYGYSYAKHDEE